MRFYLLVVLASILLFGFLQNVCYSETFKAELSKRDSMMKLQSELLQGKHTFEDLYEAAIILFDKSEFEKSQNLFELASSIQPDNLKIYKYLAEIYEITGQQERLGILADTVSGFLLPEGENDEFYETMLTSSIIMKSRSLPEEAWRSFSRLSLTLRDKPGRFRKIIKILEKKVYLPFLARIYRALKAKGSYDEFMWGELGDYYLFSGDKDKARYFLEQELDHVDFDPRFLYSYALVLFNQREFPLSQVYINLGLKLNDDSLVLKKLNELQLNISEYIYDVGVEQIRKEAELLFKFGRKDLAIKRMEQLVLLSENDARSFFEIGKILIEYPRQYDTWSEGRDYLVKYSKFTNLSFQELMAACELLFKRSMYEDMASILKILQAKFPRESEKSDQLRLFKKTVISALTKSIELFELHASRDDLYQYLNLLIDFDPYLLDPYIKLGGLIEQNLSNELSSRKMISPNTIETTEAFLSKLENYALPRHNQTASLHYIRGKLTTFYPSKQRNFSREIVSFKRCLDLDSNYFLASLALAENYNKMGFYRQSIKVLDDLIIRLSSTDNELLKRAKELHVENNVQSASQAYSNENYFLVLEYMSKALEFNQGRLISLESTIWLGYAQFYMERHTENIELLKKGIEIYGDTHEILYLMALSQEGVYKLDEAVLWYDKVIALGPADNMFVQECEKNRDNLKEIINTQRQAVTNDSQ